MIKLNCDNDSHIPGFSTFSPTPPGDAGSRLSAFGCQGDEVMMYLFPHASAGGIVNGQDFFGVVFSDF
jgi:hypothetical protein